MLCIPCCACCTSCSHSAQTLFLGHSPGMRPGCGAAAVRWGDQNPLSHLPQHPWGRECSLFHSRSLSVTWSTDPLASPHVPESPLSVPRTGTPSVAPHPSASPGEAGSPQLWGPEGRVPSGSSQLGGVPRARNSQRSLEPTPAGGSDPRRGSRLRDRRTPR